VEKVVDRALAKTKNKTGKDHFFTLSFEKALSVRKKAIRKPPKRYKKIIFGNSKSSFVALDKAKGVKNNSPEVRRK